MKTESNTYLKPSCVLHPMSGAMCFTSPLIGRLATPLPASTSLPDFAQCLPLDSVSSPSARVFESSQVRSCRLAEFEISSSVLNRSYSSQGTEKTLNDTPPPSFRTKETFTLCSNSESQLPPWQGQRSSWGKECSNHWFGISLLFLHENFIGIAFQINMSVKLKGR